MRRSRSIGLQLLATALTLRAVELTTEPQKTPKKDRRRKLHANAVTIIEKPAPRKAILLRLDTERWERFRQCVAIERRPTQTVLVKLIDDYIERSGDAR